MKFLALELHKCLGRSTGDLKRRARQEEEIGRGIQAAQGPVGIEEGTLERGLEAVTQHQLKHISLVNVASCLFDQGRILGLRKLAPEGSKRTPRSALARRLAVHQLPQFFECAERIRVIFFQAVQRYVHNEHHLLPVVVKGDEFRKEHEIHILKAFSAAFRKAQGRLRILDVVVGKVADQAAGKGRQALDARCPVIPHELPYLFLRVCRATCFLPYLQLAVSATDGQSGIESQKTKSPPAFLVLRGFKEEAVGAAGAQNAQHFHRRSDVRVELRCERRHCVKTAVPVFPEHIKTRKSFHTLSPLFVPRRPP